MTSTNTQQYTLTTKIHYPSGTIRGLYPNTPWEIQMKQQPQWIQGLLEYVTFEDIMVIIEELTSSPYILMVSDGSGKAQSMTFGWVMCTPGGHRLAQAAGHCQGRESSLRAEATGMLSATVFIALLQQYRQENITPVKVQYTSDNLELIRRELKHTNYRDSYPNTTLTAEYDVTEQIYLTNQSNQIEATYSWVRGHQDQYRNTSELSLEAKLNIEADKLAGDFQQQYGKHIPIVPLLPSSPAMLSIRGISITSQYRHQLHRAYLEPRYISKLQEKFKWEDKVVEEIEWKCLSLAIKRIHREVITTKCCNDLLPTALTLATQEYQDTDTCHLCGAVETREHLLQCSHPSRISWRISTISQIRDSLIKHQVQASIIDALCSCVTDWLDNGTVRDAIASQNRIGWRQLFMGKISTEWLHLPNSYTATRGADRPPYIWGTSVVEICLRQYIALWEQRNKEIHDPSNELHLEKQRLAKATRKLHNLRHKAQFKDAALFPENVEQFIETSTVHRLKEYIAMNKQAILKSVKKAGKAAAKQTQPIYRFFQPVRNAVSRLTAPWKPDRLKHDAYSKKKKNRTKRLPQSNQPRLTGYLSLRQTYSKNT